MLCLNTLFWTRPVRFVWVGGSLPHFTKLRKTFGSYVKLLRPQNSQEGASPLVSVEFPPSMSDPCDPCDPYDPYYDHPAVPSAPSYLHARRNTISIASSPSTQLCGRRS